eukprot:gene15373-21457_t
MAEFQTGMARNAGELPKTVKRDPSQLEVDRVGAKAAEHTLRCLSLRSLQQLLDKLTLTGITLPSNIPPKPGQHRMLCPVCSGGTTKEVSFELLIEEDCTVARYYCFRATCGAKGVVNLLGSLRPMQRQATSAASLDIDITMPPVQAVLEFFQQKGISAETLNTCGVGSALARDPQGGVSPVLCAVFPCYPAPEPVASGEGTGSGTQRGPLLASKSLLTAEKPPVNPSTEEEKGNNMKLLVVEDVMDRLSMVEVGYPKTAVVALPSGSKEIYANQLRKLKAKELRGGFDDPIIDGVDKGEALDYITTYQAVFEDWDAIVLALQTDDTGPASSNLAEEISRRLGRERCMRLQWPSQLSQLPPPSPESPEYEEWMAMFRPGQSEGEEGLPPDQIEEQEGFTPDQIERQEGLPPDEIAGQEGEVQEGELASTMALEPNSETNSSHPETVETTKTTETTEAASSNPPGASEGGVGTSMAFVPRNSANDLLARDGVDALVWYVENMQEPWPVTGLLRFNSFFTDIIDFYEQARPFAEGVSTGWEGLDEFYKVVPGELSIVTGIPNSGKSEWLDALAVNLAHLYGWRFGLCSFEKQPHMHARQLLEKYAQKTFFDSDMAGQRMSKEEVSKGLLWMDSMFHLIRKDGVPKYKNRGGFAQDSTGTGDNYFDFEDKPSAGKKKRKPRKVANLLADPSQPPSLLGWGAVANSSSLLGAEGVDEPPTIDWVLEKARFLVKRYGIRGLIIDPYNKLDHKRENYMSETDYGVSNHVHLSFRIHPSLCRSGIRGLIIDPCNELDNKRENYMSETDYGVSKFMYGIRGLIIDPYNELDHKRENYMSETDYGVYGIRGLIIDPYNELDHKRENYMSETEYVSKMLSKVKRFAQNHDCHVWFVAHPKQLQEWSGAAPSLYDISGSAHFMNKADNGLVVHSLYDISGSAHFMNKAVTCIVVPRNWGDPNHHDPGLVGIHVLKVRNKTAGKVGVHQLRYDRSTGRYEDAGLGLVSPSRASYR